MFKDFVRGFRDGLKDETPGTNWPGWLDWLIKGAFLGLIAAIIWMK